MILTEPTTFEQTSYHIGITLSFEYLHQVNTKSYVF